MSGYTGWELDPKSRMRLMAKFPPKYEVVIGNHITDTFPAKDTTPLPQGNVGKIVGVVDDGKGVQALVVEINGTTRRPDGKTYHITWSRGADRRSMESNIVIQAQGWDPLIPIRVKIAPRFFPTSNS